MTEREIEHLREILTDIQQHQRTCEYAHRSPAHCLIALGERATVALRLTDALVARLAAVEGENEMYRWTERYIARYGSQKDIALLEYAEKWARERIAAAQSTQPSCRGGGSR